MQKNSHEFRLAMLSSKMEKIASLLSRADDGDEEIERALWEVECDATFLIGKLEVSLESKRQGGKYVAYRNSYKTSTKSSNIVANEAVPSMRAKTVQSLPSVRGKRNTILGIGNGKLPA